MDQEYGKLEQVDSFEMREAGFYTFYLPPGKYSFHIFSDLNKDGYFNSDECVGEDNVMAEFVILNNADSTTSNVVKRDIDIQATSWTSEILVSIPVNDKKSVIASEKFPLGSIRSLDDEIFKIQYGVLGLYNPAAFLKISSMYFYALEDHDSRKIPILFVHGIGGSPVEFRKIVENLDREKFQPWFFYYPSGRDLQDVADIMYEIFFSGKLANIKRKRLVVVAHSTPFPKNADYHLFFSYNNPDPGSTRSNSDGSVDLKSQLDPRIQFSTPYLYGFNENHVSILESEFVLKKLNAILEYY